LFGIEIIILPVLTSDFWFMAPYWTYEGNGLHVAHPMSLFRRAGPLSGKFAIIEIRSREIPDTLKSKYQ
jgi:hypothetical protein